VNFQQGIIKDLSVKLLAKWCKLLRIVSSLLHANYKENLMTRFSTNKQNRFYRPVYIYSCCHGNGTYVILTIKKPKFVSFTCLLPVLATEGSRGLEKKVNETQVSKLCLATLNNFLIQKRCFCPFLAPCSCLQ